MKVTKYELWDKIPGTTNTKPYIMHYEPDKKVTDSAVIIMPGSGYAVSPAVPTQEGSRVAEYICKKGINVFISEYRVKPDYFPLPILDGRRAVRFVRHNSEKFGINKNKIAVMGYSAGGHLVASLSSFTEKIDFEGLDEVDGESFAPDFQILCYPVISLDKDRFYTHEGSATSLLGEKYEDYKDKLSLENPSDAPIPPTFIWHNFDDTCVNVINSLKYAEKIRKMNVPAEIHIFPDGNHGMGLPVEDRKDYNHAKQWLELSLDWLKYNDFFA